MPEFLGCYVMFKLTIDVNIYKIQLPHTELSYLPKYKMITIHNFIFSGKYLSSHLIGFYVHLCKLNNAELNDHQC
jgi:flagellar biosynthesis protein FliQ